MKNKKLFAILTLVCFMMTLMPVAAFAALVSVDAGESYVYTDETNASVDTTGVKSDGTPDYDWADICFDFTPDGSTDSMYVWFVKEDSNTAAEKGITSKDGITPTNGVFNMGTVTEGTKYSFAFDNTGKYTVHAALTDPLAKYNVSGGFATKAEAFKNAEYELMNLTSRKVIEVTSSSKSRDYETRVEFDGSLLNLVDGTPATAVADGDVVDATTVVIPANNVTEKEFKLKFVDANGKAIKGETVTLETNSANIELNKEKDVTDQLGEFKFKISGVRDGDYKIYVKCGSYEMTINVRVGATGAQDIKVVKSPEAPIDVTSDLKAKIQFTFADANSNAVKPSFAEGSGHGAFGAFHSDQNLSDSASGVTDARQYVAIVSQPSASKAENKDFKLVPDTKNLYRANLAYTGTKDLAEGTYEIKVVLDNGKYVTVKFEVKEFQTPVSLNLKYDADAVELNSFVDVDTLEWVDANGVTKDATGKVDLAANGYAVLDFDTTGSTAGRVYTKNDDKYVGSKITVVAVDDRYNLTAQAELTVSDEASALTFDTKTLALNVNNKVGVSVVDSNGNKVALNRGVTTGASISYVVLDKPAESKVSVNTDGSDNNLLEEGTFVMNVTANKVGNVTIQAVAKVTYSDKNQKQVVKYYTGTQIFAVGKDSVGQVVVMSIGSSEVIVNDKKVSIDAVPMVKNDRTFVPFRALAEAFGAEVAYDEATQAITAELNGVKVVMTIGSATYTVNGAEKTMDVAPFINGSRTMVPVRFSAEAFGIKVIPTYDQNGGTADILFNL